MNKYEITNIQHPDNPKLHQIKALKDFGSVKAGDLGGYIEKESNLSQEGDCWVYPDAWVYGNAGVYGNAWVSGDAQVRGNAQVSDSARVYGNAQVYGNAWVSGYVCVFGNALVFGNARVRGNALLTKPNHCATMQITEDYALTIFKQKKGWGWWYKDIHGNTLKSLYEETAHLPEALEITLNAINWEKNIK